MSHPTILVLAGGLGTRLRPLTTDLPKVLVPTLGRPFLEFVLDDFARQGFDDFVISVGFLADQVQAHFGDGSAFGYRVRYAREKEPLGTGGAVRLALGMLRGTFILVNGDTLLEVDLDALLSDHRAGGCGMTMAATFVPDRGRYGTLRMDDDRVAGFDEKQPGAGPGWINGGVAALEPSFFDGAPQGPFSMEQAWLPQKLGHIAVHKTRGFFVDMGTHQALSTLDEALAEYLDGR